jgi:hypothetical protein
MSKKSGAFYFSSFVLRHQFVIRHSCFVIFTKDEQEQEQE